MNKIGLDQHTINTHTPTKSDMYEPESLILCLLFYNGLIWCFLTSLYAQHNFESLCLKNASIILSL
jgi:hypothetical protein